MGFPGGSDGKASACNAGDLGSIPGSGRSPGEGNGNPLQYSCLENPIVRGAWWVTVHGVASSVQFSCSVMSDSVTPWTAAHHTSLSITNSRSLLKLMSIELVMPSNHLILCCPLLLPLIFPRIRVFASVLRIRWPEYWSFSFSISPSNEYSRLISFRID